MREMDMDSNEHLAWSGVTSLALGLAISPLLGLIPPLISFAIYLHKQWVRRQRQAKEVEALRAEILLLKKKLVEKS